MLACFDEEEEIGSTQTLIPMGRGLRIKEGLKEPKTSLKPDDDLLVFVLATSDHHH